MTTTDAKTTHETTGLRPARGLVRLLTVASLLAVAAPVTHADEAASSAERAIVVLQNGSRMEVRRAWQEGDSYRLQLLSGGSVLVPADHVKRVSRNAADLPLSRNGVGVAAARAGGGRDAASGVVSRVPERVAVAPGGAAAGDGSGAAGVPAAPAPFAVDAFGPGSAVRPAGLAAANVALRSRADAAAAARDAAQAPRGVVSETATATPALPDVTPRPGQMRRVLQRINSPGRRIEGAAEPRR